EADRDGEEPDFALRFQVRGMEVANVLWGAGLGLVPASRARWATTCWVAAGRASPAVACFIAARRAGSARSVSSMLESISGVFGARAAPWSSRYFVLPSSCPGMGR